MLITIIFEKVNTLMERGRGNLVERVMSKNGVLLVVPVSEGSWQMVWEYSWIMIVITAEIVMTKHIG